MAQIHPNPDFPHNTEVPTFTADWHAANTRGKQMEMLDEFNSFLFGDCPSLLARTPYGKRAIAAGFEEPAESFSCLLDAVLVWLVEGNATQLFSSFEEYLIGVICLIDRQRNNMGEGLELLILKSARDNGGVGFDVFNWGKPPQEDSPSFDAWLYRDHEYPKGATVPEGWSPYVHPALDKAVFLTEKARERDTSNILR